jgi:uncharacterized protein (TIGR02996 family)
MAEQDELVQEVLDHPDDDAPRLAYADWCDRQTDEPTRARGEFIRAQITLSRHLDSLTYEEWFDVSNREEQLRKSYRSVWAGDLAVLVGDYTFNRGFIEFISLSARRFLEHATQLLTMAPILHLKLSEVLTVLDELFESPYLRSIRSLDLERCGLLDDHIRKIAQSPVLEHLRWLSLAENNLGLGAAEALAESPLSKQLVYVSFYHNAVDPGGLYAADNEFIMDSWLPDEGKLLESRYGVLPWLHRNADTIFEVVPNRFQLGA